MLLGGMRSDPVCYMNILTNNGERLFKQTCLLSSQLTRRDNCAPRRFQKLALLFRRKLQISAISRLSFIAPAADL